MPRPRPRFARSLAIILATCMTLLFACSTGSDDSGAASGGTGGEKVLRFVSVYPANTTDAQVVHTAFILNSGAVGSLVGLDPDTLQLYPWLAESWETPDAQHWTFQIRQGVTFHNGNPLNAEAVRASLAHALEANPGVVAALKIQDMQVVDDHTLTITTESVYPALISNLVHYNTVITDVTDSADVPVGTGAFKFASFDPAGEAVLVRNTEYWDGRAKLDKVIMTANEDSNARVLALRAGDADIIYRPSLESIQALENEPGVRWITRVLAVQLTAGMELGTIAEFRRGIDALMDRQAVIDGVMAGQGTVAFNPFPGDWPFSPTPLDHASGTDAALKHFEAAGLQVNDGKVSKDGQPLNLKIVPTPVELPDASCCAPRAGRHHHDSSRSPRTSMSTCQTTSTSPPFRGDGAVPTAPSAGGAQNHGSPAIRSCSACWTPTTPRSMLLPALRRRGRWAP